MKLELGAGHRPTRGYEHNDLYPFDHIEHVGPPWMIDLPDDSLEEVLALAFIEHLTYYEALDTFRNVARMLKPGGVFTFDVPDYPIWAAYYLQHVTGKYQYYDDAPPLDRVRQTLFGWGRWPGDEHKFGWDEELLVESLASCGLTAVVNNAVIPHLKKRVHRDRFDHPEDAHLYVVAQA